MNKAIIFDIQHGSVVDGPGMRTTFFSKVVILGVAGVTIPKVNRPSRRYYSTRTNAPAAAER